MSILSITSDATQRLFVAVPLSAEFKAAVSVWCDTKVRELPFKKWAHPDDLHITLHFLGDTPGERIAAIEQAVRHAACSTEPFSLAIESPGTFGRPDKPSVLWAGIGGELDALHQLNKRILSRLAPLGYEPENRPYHPHLTLARDYRSPVPFEPSMLESCRIPLTEDGAPLRWAVNDIVLYRSRLQRQPLYEVVSRFPLDCDADDIT
ncbi:RNA 2',3'-cyclic phosphodiesterase [Paenibacillus spongiae]|uniref:RNA 2',3'-cyclic phosphodiesterase n=1 Tax=Paenibacillus spongiae TaxID=2909671 RepID=A0ABY5SB76_9BACL|nr:RNA 2',3'-cyclic phosphodiesterase [Paenibacillus spongiae]UVI30785.1 RNA 2',3'-cyclic phosphodiesterase [Paenibacillus spongiae]